MIIIKKTLFSKIFRIVIAPLLVFLLWGLISLYSFTPILNLFISKEEGYIPDLKGKTKEEAIELLNEKGFQYNIKLIEYKAGCNPGTVFSTYPRSPWKINKNRVIELNVYNKQGQVVVLEYKELTLQEARKQAKKNKLSIRDIEEEPFYGKEEFFGKISAQVPSKGRKVNEGAILDLWIYRQADDLYIVPAFYEKDLSVVISRLKEEGFLIGEITYITDDSRLKNSVIKLGKINRLGMAEEIYETDPFRGQPITVYITVTK